MIKNRKLWLILKGFFILLLSFHFYYDPPTDPNRKILRSSIILIFTISFVVDLYKFSKNK